MKQNGTRPGHISSFSHRIFPFKCSSLQFSISRDFLPLLQTTIAPSFMFLYPHSRFDALRRPTGLNFNSWRGKLCIYIRPTCPYDISLFHLPFIFIVFFLFPAYLYNFLVSMKKMLFMEEFTISWYTFKILRWEIHETECCSILSSTVTGH
jgi:hypothetical protein